MIIVLAERTSWRRTLIGAGAALGLPILLVVTFALDPFAPSTPPLASLVPPDADVVIHVPATAGLAEAWRNHRLIKEMQGSPGWRAVWGQAVGATREQAAALAATLSRLAPGRAESWTPAPADILDGELLLAGGLAAEEAPEPAARKPGSSLYLHADTRPPFPFRWLVAVMRPRAAWPATALRAALARLPFERFVRPRLPADAGATLEGDVLVVADPDAALGQTAFRGLRPPPSLCLAVVHDLVIAGTDLDRVQRIAAAARRGSAETPAAAEPAANPISVSLGRRARARLAPKLAAVLGADLAEILTGLLTADPARALRIEGTLARCAEIAVFVPGDFEARGAPPPPPPPDGVTATASIGLAPADLLARMCAAARRIDPHARALDGRELLDDESRPLPELGVWLDEEGRLTRLETALRATARPPVTLWFSPRRGPQPHPAFAAPAALMAFETTDGGDAVRAALAEAGLIAAPDAPNPPDTTWHDLDWPALAGFHEEAIRPAVAIAGAGFFAGSHRPSLPAEPPATAGDDPRARFDVIAVRTSGSRLARLLARTRQARLAAVAIPSVADLADFEQRLDDDLEHALSRATRPPTDEQLAAWRRDRLASWRTAWERRRGAAAERLDAAEDLLRRIGEIDVRGERAEGGLGVRITIAPVVEGGS